MLSRSIPITIRQIKVRHPSLVLSAPHQRISGRKKLKQLEAEIQRVISVRHDNLLSIYAVKLTTPQSSGPPRLAILMEQRPALTLRDVLEDCEALREERATVSTLLVNFTTPR